MAKKTQQSRNLGEKNTGSKDKDNLDELFFQLATKINSIRFLSKRSIKASDITRLKLSNSAKKKRFDDYPAPSIQDILFYNTLTHKESSDIPFELIIRTITDKISLLESLPDNSLKPQDARQIIEFDINKSIDPDACHINPYLFSLDDILYYHSLFSSITSDHEQSRAHNFNGNSTPNIVSHKKPPEVATSRHINRRWIESGESITIQGFQITCGLFYVGTDAWPSDISIINPLLPVEHIPHHHRHKSNKPDGYPLPYKYMHPKTRGDYLAWLSEGRNPAGCDISFLKLYLSGLERRVFCDISHHTNKKDTKKEVQDILCYIKELLQHFNKSDQISRKIREFENFLVAYGLNKESELQSRGAPPPDPIPPLGLLTSALEFSARGEAIPGYLAYDLWKEYRQDKAPSIVDYFPETFRDIAIEKFNAKLAKKIKIRPQKHHDAKLSKASPMPKLFSLTIGYRPINCHIDSQIFLTRIEMPHVFWGAKTERLLSIDKIDKIAEAEQYNCLYNSNPRNLLNLLSLPFILWPPKFREVARDLPGLILSDSKYRLISFSDILSLFFCDIKPRKKYHGPLFVFLSECSIGVEPDPRLWDDLFDSRNFVAYQESPYKIQSSLTTNYKLSALALNIAAGMNLIETDINNNEYYDRLVETQINLTGNEMTRLSAHLRWLILSDNCKPSQRKLINLVKEDEKERVGRSLIDYTRCQGLVTVQMINRLEDAFRKLSISNELLYSQLHLDQFYSTATRSSRGINKNDKTQPNKESSSNHFALDVNRLAELEIESNNIGGILNNIFQEEPGHHSSRLKEHDEKNTDTKGENGLLGLTGDLSEFLRAVLGRLEWSKSELEELATSHSLMLDGALEILNESTFDHLDEPLFEDFESGNLMTVNKNVIQSLTSE